MLTNTKTQSEPKPDEPSNGTDKVMTRAELSKIANVSDGTVTTWIESGALPAFDVSADGAKYRNWRIYESDWKAFQTKRGNKGFANRQSQPESGQSTVDMTGKKPYF